MSYIESQTLIQLVARHGGDDDKHNLKLLWFLRPFAFAPDGVSGLSSEMDDTNLHYCETLCTVG